MKNKLLNQVTKYYLKSRGFNGSPVSSLNLTKGALSIIEELVKDGLITINFGDLHPNPHIQAFKPEQIDMQIKKIKTIGLNYACLYPSKKHLSKVVNRTKYLGKPFTLMLALGEPSLDYRVFDLSIVEHYRNEPRYHYESDDIHGTLSIRSDYSKKGKIYKRDKVFIQTFGFAYNKSFNRAVAVYIHYLSTLTPEHQQLWYNKILKGEYRLHPDYQRATMGHWPERVSIFTAFIEELHQINKMVKLLGKPVFFRDEYSRDKKPKGFAFLIRPTLKEFYDFAHLLDKLMSENINKDFFRGDVSMEHEEALINNRFKVVPKGTINLLDEWLKRIRFPDLKPKDEMLEVFRRVRGLRQLPAHKIHEDVFDQKYFKKQRKLIMEAYGAVRTLRLIFANHPKVKGYQGVPDWLFKGEIWTY